MVERYSRHRFALSMDFVKIIFWLCRDSCIFSIYFNFGILKRIESLSLGTSLLKTVPFIVSDNSLSSTVHCGMSAHCVVLCLSPALPCSLTNAMESNDAHHYPKLFNLDLKFLSNFLEMFFWQKKREQTKTMCIESNFAQISWEG